MSFGRRAMLASAVFGLAAIAAGGVWLTRDDGSNPGEGMLRVEDVDLSALDRVNDATWNRLADMRIYFAHQSVGWNMLAGIEDIQKRKPRVRLNIVESRDKPATTAGAFTHSGIGRNQHPFEKIDDFSKMVSEGAGAGTDIALVKLCYVDINDDRDVDALFKSYDEAMSRLRREHPNTVIVRVTSPLTTVERGPKARIKALLGRYLHGHAENANRERFNDMVRKSAADAGSPLLDLAKIESTLPDGTTATYMHAGRPVACLAERYTHDGGHLNDAGRMIAARDLLLLLAGIAAERTEGSVAP